MTARREKVRSNKNLTERIEIVRTYDLPQTAFAKCITRKGAILQRSISRPCCRPGIRRRTVAPAARAGRFFPERQRPDVASRYPSVSSPGQSVIRRGPRARRKYGSRRNSRGPWPRPLSRRLASIRTLVQCRGRGTCEARPRGGERRERVSGGGDE